ncbi:hypothetical protein [Streptomyces bambusae]|nr:hypothetical protein [Streptomyces bambusae]
MNDTTADPAPAGTDGPDVEVEDLEASAAAGCASTVGTMSSLVS